MSTQHEQWTKASASGGSGGQCVEVELHGTPGIVRVRHSKRPDEAVIDYTHEEWLAFLDGVRKNEFDL